MPLRSRGDYPVEVNNFIVLLTDAKAYVSDADKVVLDGYISTLTTALG